MVTGREEVSSTGILQHVGFTLFLTYTIFVLGQGLTKKKNLKIKKKKEEEEEEEVI